MPGAQRLLVQHSVVKQQCHCLPDCGCCCADHLWGAPVLAVQPEADGQHLASSILQPIWRETSSSGSSSNCHTPTAQLPARLLSWQQPCTETLAALALSREGRVWAHLVINIAWVLQVCERRLQDLELHCVVRALLNLHTCTCTWTCRMQHQVWGCSRVCKHTSTPQLRCRVQTQHGALKSRWGGCCVMCSCCICQ